MSGGGNGGAVARLSAVAIQLDSAHHQLNNTLVSCNPYFYPWISEEEKNEPVEA